jgi:Zn finger protein HypA/HybF involved in hydrogenase expression
MRCRSCGTEYVPQALNWLCPECQAIGGETLSGREFLVESIEVE